MRPTRSSPRQACIARDANPFDEAPGHEGEDRDGELLALWAGMAWSRPLVELVALAAQHPEDVVDWLEPTRLAEEIRAGLAIAPYRPTCPPELADLRYTFARRGTFMRAELCLWHGDYGHSGCPHCLPERRYAALDEPRLLEGCQVVRNLVKSVAQHYLDPDSATGAAACRLLVERIDLIRGDQPLQENTRQLAALLDQPDGSGPAGSADAPPIHPATDAERRPSAASVPTAVPPPPPAAGTEVPAPAPAMAPTSASDPPVLQRAARRGRPQLLDLHWQLATDGLEQARHIALAWLARKLRTAIAMEREGSFEYESAEGLVRIEAVADAFAARLEHPDSQNPLRTWRVDIVLFQAGGTAYAGVQLMCRDRGRAAAPVLAPPRLIDDWLRAGLLCGDGHVLGRVLTPATTMDALALRRELEDPERTFPILLLGTAHTEAAHAPVLRALGGVARIVQLTPESAPDITKRIGEVAPGGARLVQPRCRYSPEDDLPVATLDPYSLRAARPPAIEAVQPREGAVPDFVTVRGMIGQYRMQALQKAGSSAAAITAAHAQIDRLTEELREALTHRQEAEDARRAVQLENEQLRAELDQLRGEVHVLGVQLQAMQASEGVAAPEQSVQELTPVPDTLAEFGAWCDAHLGERFFVTQRARKECEKSVFRNPPAVYEALIAMRDHYWPSKFDADADPGGRERWERVQKEQRFICSPSGQAPTSRYGEHYRADYSGGRVTLDMHIKGRRARGTSQTLRIYFYIDYERRLFVVGSLPEHLPSDRT